MKWIHCVHHSLFINKKTQQISLRINWSWRRFKSRKLTTERQHRFPNRFQLLLFRSYEKICKIGETVAVETRFGCILLIQIFLKNMKVMFFFISLGQPSVTDNVYKTLARFCDLETLGISENENYFHEDFTWTIYLKEENRCEVKFSFKETHLSLQGHYKLCPKCLLQFCSWSK